MPTTAQNHQRDERVAWAHAVRPKLRGMNFEAFHPTWRFDKATGEMTFLTMPKFSLEKGTDRKRF